MIVRTSPITAAALLAIACVPIAAKAQPRAQAIAVPPRTYQNACASCHDNGGFGVRVLKDRPGSQNALIHERGKMNPALIRAAVRRGIGAMPPMSRIEVSDSELDRIVAYLGRDVGGSKK